MTKVKSFEVSTGEHWVIRLSARDAAGLPLDLTDGFGELGIEGNGIVKVYDGIVQDAEAGTIDFTVSPSDHIDVVPGEYLYEILITPGTGISSVQARGILTVLEGALVANAPLAIGSGYYQITGLDAGILHSTQILTAGASSYAITGNDVTLKHANLTIGADSGSYLVTGTNVALTHAGWTIAAGSGSYAVTGTDAALVHAQSIAAGGGSYALTGTDVTLTHAAIIGSYVTSPAAHTNNSATYSDAGVSTGTADAARVTVVVAHWELSGTDRYPTFITLDGNNMTEIGRSHGITVGGVGIYALANPTGTTSTIACAGSSDTGVFLAMQFSVYRLVPASATPVDSGTGSGASPVNITDIEVKSGGFLICAAINTNTNALSASYNGVDTPVADFTTTLESVKYCIAWSTVTSENITTNDPGVSGTSSSIKAVAASWL